MSVKPQMYACDGLDCHKESVAPLDFHVNYRPFHTATSYGGTDLVYRNSWDFCSPQCLDSFMAHEFHVSQEIV